MMRVGIAADQGGFTLKEEMAISLRRGPRRVYLESQVAESLRGSGTRSWTSAHTN